MHFQISFTVVSVLIACLLATSGDMQVTWTSPVYPKLYSNDTSINPLGRPITGDEDTWIGSLINIGSIIGPFPYSYISHHYGRKLAMLCIAIPHFAAYLTMAFAKSVYLFYFARCFAGAALGGGYTLLPMYIAEITVDSNRGALSNTLVIFWSFGNLIPYVTGPFMSIMWFNILLSCIPAIFFVLFLLVAPETPYYLASVGKMEKAKESITKLRPTDKSGIEKDLEHIMSVLQNEEHGQLKDIFKSRALIKAFAISLILVGAQQWSGTNAIYFYTETIFKEVGTDDPVVSSIIVGAVIFLTSFFSPLTVEWAGRRTLLLFSCVGLTLSLAAMGTYSYLHDETNVHTESFNWLPIVILASYILFSNSGLNSIPWTLSSEMFPSHVKPVAASATASTCSLVSFIITKFFNDMKNEMGMGPTFWLFGGFSLFTTIFTYFVVPETKGKSFIEIQQVLGAKTANS